MLNPLRQSGERHGKDHEHTQVHNLTRVSVPPAPGSPMAANTTSYFRSPLASGYKPCGAVGAWLWLTLSTCTAKVVPSHSSLHACPAGHGRLFGRGNAGRPTQSTQSPGASGSPNQWHKDVFLPASSISVTVQESKAGLGLAMQSAELRHGLVTSAIKEYSGGKLFTLMIWLVSSPQISVQELTILQRLPGKPGHSRLGSFNINNAESQPEKFRTLKLQQQGP